MLSTWRKARKKNVETAGVSTYPAIQDHKDPGSVRTPEGVRHPGVRHPAKDRGVCRDSMVIVKGKAAFIHPHTDLGSIIIHNRSRLGNHHKFEGIFDSAQRTSPCAEFLWDAKTTNRRRVGWPVRSPPQAWTGGFPLSFVFPRRLVFIPI